MLCSRREGLLQASILATLFVAGPAAGKNCLDCKTMSCSRPAQPMHHQHVIQGQQAVGTGQASTPTTQNHTQHLLDTKLV